MKFNTSPWFLRSAAAAVLAGGCGLILPWVQGATPPAAGPAAPPSVQFDWLTQGPAAPATSAGTGASASAEPQAWSPTPPPRGQAAPWPAANSQPQPANSIQWPPSQPRPAEPELAGMSEVLRLPPVAAISPPKQEKSPAPSVAAQPDPGKQSPKAKSVPWSGPVGRNVAEPTRVDSSEDPASGPEIAVTRQAEARIARAIELADRRAYYSARSEFLQALTLLARAKDSQENDTKHMAALRAAVTALEESADFITPEGLVQTPLTVEALVAGHRTPVYQHGAGQVPHVEALRAYYTFAQEQFGRAMGKSPAASSALYGLGKLYAALGKEPSPRVADAATQAVVFHQAALIVHENNWQAANELAVLLTQAGRLEEAQSWLAHSVRVSPRAENWHNLSVVRQRLGQVRLAEEARREAQNLANRQPTSILRGGAPPVDLVSPAAFVGQDATTKQP